RAPRASARPQPEGVPRERLERITEFHRRAPERCVMKMTQPQGPTAPKQTPPDTGSWQRALLARQVRFRRTKATRFMPLIVSPPAPVKWAILEKNDASMRSDLDDSQQETQVQSGLTFTKCRAAQGSRHSGSPTRERGKTSTRVTRHIDLQA